MINRCCSKSIDFLIDSGSLNSEDKELYMYSMRVLVCGLINAITAIAIGVAMGMFWQGVGLFVTFFIVRKFAGGMHADKYKNCFVSSVFVNVLALGAIYLFENTRSVNMFITCLIISIVVIISLSPLDNPNKPLTEKEQRIYRGISIAVSLVILIVSVICVMKDAPIGYSFGTGLILVSLLLTAGVMSNIKKDRFLR